MFQYLTTISLLLYYYFTAGQENTSRRVQGLEDKMYQVLNAQVLLYHFTTSLLHYFTTPKPQPYTLNQVHR